MEEILNQILVVLAEVANQSRAYSKELVNEFKKLETLIENYNEEQRIKRNIEAEEE